MISTVFRFIPWKLSVKMFTGKHFFGSLIINIYFWVCQQYSWNSRVTNPQPTMCSFCNTLSNKEKLIILPISGLLFHFHISCLREKSVIQGNPWLISLINISLFTIKDAMTFLFLRQLFVFWTRKKLNLWVLARSILVLGIHKLECVPICSCL